MKRHIEFQKCKHCHTPIGYDLMTVNCLTRVVFFLTCESCKTENTFVWSDGLQFQDPNQLKLFQGSTKL